MNFRSLNEDEVEEEEVFSFLGDNNLGQSNSHNVIVSIVNLPFKNSREEPQKREESNG